MANSKLLLIKKFAENLNIHETQNDAPKGFFKSAYGNLISLRWKQFYHYVKFGKVPAEWRRTFEVDDDIGNFKTESAAMLQPVSGK